VLVAAGRIEITVGQEQVDAVIRVAFPTEGVRISRSGFHEPFIRQMAGHLIDAAG
jgi:hypothetical protein